MYDQNNLQNIIKQLQGQLELLLIKKDTSTEEINNLRKRIEFLQKQLSGEGSDNLTENYPENLQTQIRKETESDNTHRRKRRISRQTLKNKNIIAGVFILAGIGFILYALYLVLQHFSGGENENPLLKLALSYLFSIGLSFAIYKIGKRNTNIRTGSVVIGLIMIYLITFFAYSSFGIITLFTALSIAGTASLGLIIFSLFFKNSSYTFIGIASMYVFGFHLNQNTLNTLLFLQCITIANILSCIITYKNKWKKVFNVFTGISWLLTILWLIRNYTINAELLTIVYYSTFHFFIFYLTYILFRFSERRKSVSTEIMLVILNSFIYYLNGTIILFLTSNEEFFGLFTLSNLALHLITGTWVLIMKEKHTYLIRIATGKVIFFFSISLLIYAPLTAALLLILLIGALLLWYGRSKKLRFYERFSVPLIFLPSLGFIFTDSRIYQIFLVEIPVKIDLPFLNFHFLSYVIALAIFSFIIKVIRNPHSPTTFSRPAWLAEPLRKGIFFIPILLLFFSMLTEIDTILNLIYSDSLITALNETEMTGIIYPDKFLFIRKIIWYADYSVFILSIVSLYLQRRIKRQSVAKPILFVNAFVVLLFLFLSHFMLKEIWSEYLISRRSGSYLQGLDYFLLRYISFFLLSFLLLVCYRYVHRHFMKKIFRNIFDIILHITLIWVISSELIQWLDFYDVYKSNTLWLTVSYLGISLYLYFHGYIKQKNYLIYMAYLLCIFTGLKLLIYDLKYLDTLTQTILFLVLGLLFVLFSLRPGLKIRRTNY